MKNLVAFVVDDVTIDDAIDVFDVDFVGEKGTDDVACVVLVETLIGEGEGDIVDEIEFCVVDTDDNVGTVVEGFFKPIAEFLLSEI